VSLPREGESIFGPRARADYLIDENGCWVWQKATFRGYAHHGGGLKPHRLYYERAHGPVPEGCDVHHTCKNTACVNPAHLEAIDARTHDALHWLGERGLTVEDLHDIRALGRKNVQAGDVAERYGICKASVYYYWRGQSWADLLGEPGPVVLEPWPCQRAGCDELVVSERRDTKYCSLRCRSLVKDARYRKRNAAPLHGRERP
jgi:hypothetical protein